VSEKQRYSIFNCIQSLLGNIEFFSCSTTQARALLHVVIDNWYLAKEGVCNDDEFEHYTTLAIEYIRSTLFHMASRNTLFPEGEVRYLLLQSATILVQCQFGKDYEVGLIDVKMWQLLCYMSLLKVNPQITYAEINDILKVELIRKVNPIIEAELLMHLSNYVSTQDLPHFHQLKALLELKKDTTDARQLLSEIKQLAIKTMKKEKNKENRFFSMDKSAAALFALLSEGNDTETSKYLEAQCASTQPTRVSNEGVI
jgi:hypothetical protein